MVQALIFYMRKDKGRYLASPAARDKADYLGTVDNLDHALMLLNNDLGDFTAEQVTAIRKAISNLEMIHFADFINMFEAGTIDLNAEELRTYMYLRNMGFTTEGAEILEADQERKFFECTVCGEEVQSAFKFKEGHTICRTCAGILSREM